MKKTTLYALIVLGIGVLLYIVAGILGDVNALNLAKAAAGEHVYDMTNMIDSFNVLGIVSIGLSSLVLVGTVIANLFRYDEKK